ncbi:hypothetical protein NDN08_001080 [Rhodosorus marinus]|uniref:Uncharacterized protein n=1 Tax=Rhodosorus marinus TaxID=101924 RepID=A0AAV8UTF2_9RHOD|nr:hypothetical protein NDN08_001080 [Rhodosorus marinus]
MAFVGGLSVSAGSKIRGKVCQAPAVRKGVVVMMEGEENRSTFMRGLDLLKKDVTDQILEQAPSRVIGTVQDNSASASVQPGEYGYRDPLDKKKVTKKKKKQQGPSKEVTMSGAAQFDLKAQPGEYGYQAPFTQSMKVSELEALEKAEKLAEKAAEKKVSTNVVRTSLPDYLQSADIVEEEDTSDLPDYMRPLPEDSARSNWNY